MLCSRALFLGCFLSGLTSSVDLLSLGEMKLSRRVDSSEDSGFFYERINNFDCDVILSSFEPPTSVHKLRPSDVDIVSAIGDSLTAANGAGASTFGDMSKNYRGLSFDIGGEFDAPDKEPLKDVAKHFTLPNALKRYNPGLKGWSVGVENVQEEGANLNLAVPGSRAVNLTSQVRNLITEIKTNSKYDFENDWKMLTVFIGGNNLCEYCTDPRSSPENFKADVEAALDILLAETPKMFVSLLTIFRMDFINEMTLTPTCKMAQQSICPCVKKTDQESIDRLAEVTKSYRECLRELVDSGIYDVREDFTVVIQPYLENSDPPRVDDGTVDMSYFAPDCFHYSRKGHNFIARGLWNNLFQKVGHKSRELRINDEILCPVKDFPYFYTAKNSI